MRFRTVSAARGGDVGAEPGGEGGLVEFSGGEGKNGLGGVFLGGDEAVAVHFQEEHAQQEAGALVSIDKGMIANDSGGVSDREIDDVRRFPAGMKLARAGNGGCRQRRAADARRAAV